MCQLGNIPLHQYSTEKEHNCVRIKLFAFLIGPMLDISCFTYILRLASSWFNTRANCHGPFFTVEHTEGNEAWIKFVCNKITLSPISYVSCIKGSQTFLSDADVPPTSNSGPIELARRLLIPFIVDDGNGNSTAVFTFPHSLPHRVALQSTPQQNVRTSKALCKTHLISLWISSETLRCLMLRCSSFISPKVAYCMWHDWKV